MKRKRIPAFLLAVMICLSMTTGSLAASVAEDIQAGSGETPLGSVSEHGVTIDVLNAAAFKSSVFVLYRTTVSEDIELPEGAHFGVSHLAYGDWTASSGFDILVAHEGKTMTRLYQQVPDQPMSATKAVFELAYLNYIDKDTDEDKFIVTENWKIDLDLKLQDSIELTPNVQLPADGFTATLQSVSITPFSVNAKIKAVGVEAFEAKTAAVVSLKDGSKVGIDEDIAVLSALVNDDDPDAVITTTNSDYMFKTAIALEDVKSVTIDGVEIAVDAADQAGAAKPDAPIAPGTPGTPDAPGTPSEPDADAPSQWAAEQVMAAVDAGIVPEALQKGYTKAATRAEFCALAVALYESVRGTEITERKEFSDTDDINVQKMAGLGIAQGTGEDEFEPGRNLTREQAATLLSRLASACGYELAGSSPSFSDNNDISDWALSSVGQIQATNIMSGVGENRFAPQEDYTREQSIMTILRLFNLLKAA